MRSLLLVLLTVVLFVSATSSSANPPCASQADRSTLSNNASEIESAAQNCGLDCEWQEGCMSVCIARQYQLSGDCSFCYAKGYKNCWPICHADPLSDQCKACSKDHHSAVIQDCSAVPRTPACNTPADINTMQKNSSLVSDSAATCGYDCEQHEGCMSVCLSRKLGISGECAYCYAKGYNQCDPVTCPGFDIVVKNCTTINAAILLSNY
jgi:hypothetical protein